jgi:hypothetical protein
VDYDCDGDGQRETRLQRLMFVRINSEERENGELRAAGDIPFGRRYFTLTLDDRTGVLEEEFDEEGSSVYLPTGGLAEAVFMAFPPVVGNRVRADRTLSFYRGYRTPIGGEDSFFAPGALLTPAGVVSSLAPVMGGLLHLEFRFGDQDTFTFDVKDANIGEKGGAGYTWDSTRGILSSVDETGDFGFRLASGPASLSNPADDVFPSRVQITVVISSGGKREGLARLTRNLRDGDMRIQLDAVRPFTQWRFGERLVRVGSEWIRFDRVEGRELIVTERGVRNTVASLHKEGSPVFAGRTFTAQVAIPTARECWNEKD